MSPDNILMFRCDEKKANWYLSRNIAEVISEEPLTIRLMFKPKGYVNHGKGWGLTAMENRCVRCGVEENLTKHHVVPYMYRKHFPEEYKSRNHHDVLTMCVDCHERYEKLADGLKYELTKETGHQPHTPSTTKGANTLRKMQGLARILLNGEDRIPKERIETIRNTIIQENPEWDGVNDDFLHHLLNMESEKKTEGDAGSIVVEHHKDNLQEFIRMWRQHFLDMNNCSHLPENWSVDYCHTIKII
jgi:hypothetical protein